MEDPDTGTLDTNVEGVDGEKNPVIGIKDADAGGLIN